MDSLIGHASYYFFPKGTDSIQGISISGSKPIDESFNHDVITMVLRNKIPDSLISELNPPVLLFVGRKINVDSRCRWMGSNVMQCSGFGEMNWSMHPDMEEAIRQTAQQEAVVRVTNTKFTVVQEESIPITFEGVPVTARRLQLKLKGALGLLTKKMEGSRVLIVYFVTSELRGRYVSCVLSHWTSDYLEDHGLPPLLGEVMRLN